MDKSINEYYDFIHEKYGSGVLNNDTLSKKIGGNENKELYSDKTVGSPYNKTYNNSFQEIKNLINVLDNDKCCDSNCN